MNTESRFQLRWYSALALVILPGLAFPFLPESDFAIPTFGTLWLMTASGAVGGFIIDVARRASPRRQIGQVLAQVVLGLVGLTGMTAGVACLSLAIPAPEALPWRALAFFLGVGATVMVGGGYLLRVALSGGSRGIR